MSKRKIAYELIILYDRYSLKPKEIIAKGYKKSTAYNYSRITKQAQANAKAVFNKPVEEVKKA
jgi:hypothetical protein